MWRGVRVEGCKGEGGRGARNLDGGGCTAQSSQGTGGFVSHGRRIRVQQGVNAANEPGSFVGVGVAYLWDGECVQWGGSGGGGRGGNMGRSREA